MTRLLKVSKLDAAKRQLETVIRMYFNDADPVSIHTLTAAAYNILRDVNSKTGGSPMLIKDQLVADVFPEYKKEVRDLINEAENFFKHANVDHDLVLDFNPFLTEFLIMDACDKYRQLSGESHPLMVIYRGWMMMNYQDIFNLAPDQLNVLKTHSTVLISGGKSAYFKDMLYEAMKI